MARARVVIAIMMIATCFAAPMVAAQRTAIMPACSGGGSGHALVAPRVDAIFVYERCLGGDRIASIVLWRARTAGWSADADAVAFDQQGRTVVVTARDGAHPIPLGRTDSVMVVMLDYVDAIAGPIPVQTTRIAPARAAGIVPSADGTSMPRDVSDSLRTLLLRNGRARGFLER